MARRAESSGLGGRVALVTGAGRGIGRATAVALARAGASVVVAELDAAAAAAGVESVRAAGGHAVPKVLDVTDAARFAAVVAEVESELGPIEVLINNAGLMLVGGFLEHGPEEDGRQLAVNLGGVVHGMRAVLPGMLARDRGHIVNLASVAGVVGVPHAAMYSATKFAVVGLTEAVRAELLDTGVRASYVCPVLVDTELIAGTGRPRWPPVQTPEAVADAILGTLETGAVDVFVPPIARFARSLPPLLPRAISDLVGRKLDVVGMFARVDRARRAAYAARSGARVGRG